MSTFSRTIQGISNYPSFFGCDFIVYIEGKITDINGSSAEDQPDIQYYREVLTFASGGKTPKIKCVGNKLAALDYAAKIDEAGMDNSIVIVDKDLEGITCSPISTGRIIRTHGYSWENELWSNSVIHEVASLISNSNTLVASTINKNLSLLQKRLKYLSLLDAVSHLYGIALLRKGNSLGGIRFSFPSLPLNEIKRIRALFMATAASSCHLCRGMLRASSQIDSRQIIQGHLWENVAFRLIAYAYRQATGDAIPPNGVLQRLAFSVLRRDVSLAIGPSMATYYREELVRLGVVTT